MRRALSLFVFVAIVGAWVGRSAYGSLEPAKKHKVVIQVSSDDPKIWQLALNNVDNLIAALGKDNVDIKVVAYGPGLAMLKKENIDIVQRLASDKKMCPVGVQFNACGVTMKKTGVTQDDLAPYVDPTASGIVRIIELQEQGYTYIRP